MPSNTGDGLRMAMAAGAALDNMREAWWVPTVEIPGDEAFGRPRARLVLRERTLPRSIMVNRQGRRFCNEAANYNALGGAFLVNTRYAVLGAGHPELADLVTRTLPGLASAADPAGLRLAEAPYLWVAAMTGDGAVR